MLQKCGDHLCKAILMLPDSEGTIEWVHNPFPNDMEDIFFDPLFDEDEFKFGSECKESNNDCLTNTILKAVFELNFPFNITTYMISTYKLIFSEQLRTTMNVLRQKIS